MIAQAAVTGAEALISGNAGLAIISLAALMALAGASKQRRPLDFRHDQQPRKDPVMIDAELVGKAMIMISAVILGCWIGQMLNRYLSSKRKSLDFIDSLLFEKFELSEPGLVVLADGSLHIGRAWKLIEPAPTTPFDLHNGQNGRTRQAGISHG